MPIRLWCTALVLSAANVDDTLSFVPSFLPTRDGNGATSLFSGGRDDGSDDDKDHGGIEDFEQKRMKIVRSLQSSYYRDVADADRSVSDTSETTVARSSQPSATALDPTTGRMLNIPLWRVGWVETPGRRNCLNVHEMQYTHMFERILASRRPPYYFGHLYLPEGTTSARTGEERYRLRTWREELADERRFDDCSSSSTQASPDVATPTVDRSAVVGCLMQITDHRRMEDGRLMLLVQALERFVVEEVVETRPYATAHVQILLDTEELPWERRRDEGSRREKEREDEARKLLRGRAVSASFAYHAYEFDPPLLPVLGQNAKGEERFLAKDDVPWLAISKLLPFACYSADDTCLDAANKQTAQIENSVVASANILAKGGEATRVASEEMPLERELWNGGITWEPPRASRESRRRSDDCDALETLLWVALDDFCRGTGFALPEEVACLLPPELDYLGIEPKRRLSDDYPKLRRQRRLSYLAPALVENLETPMKGLRQAWLNAPSTSARLSGALERYDYLNDKIMGQFE